MFQLTQGSDTYDLDITGAAQSGGNPAGQWTTHKTNQVVLTKTDGSTVPFDVAGGFHENNQLVVSAGSKPGFNFNGGAALPLYSNQKDVLIVQPDSSAPFTFPLRGA